MQDAPKCHLITMQSNPAEIKPYTMKQLRQLYGLSDKTMRKWLKQFESDIGEKNGNLFNVNQVKIIFEKLGRPEVN